MCSHQLSAMEVHLSSPDLSWPHLTTFAPVVQRIGYDGLPHHVMSCGGVWVEVGPRRHQCFLGALRGRRNMVETMATPRKYQKMGTYGKVYLITFPVAFPFAIFLKVTIFSNPTQIISSDAQVTSASLRGWRRSPVADLRYESRDCQMNSLKNVRKKH